MIDLIVSFVVASLAAVLVSATTIGLALLTSTDIFHIIGAVLLTGTISFVFVFVSTTKYWEKK